MIRAVSNSRVHKRSEFLRQLFMNLLSKGMRRLQSFIGWSTGDAELSRLRNITARTMILGSKEMAGDQESYLNLFVAFHTSSIPNQSLPSPIIITSSFHA